MRSRKDPHDIFNLPTSLGGKGMEKSNSKGSLFSKQSKKPMSVRPPKPTFVDLTRGSVNQMPEALRSKYTADSPVDSRMYGLGQSTISGASAGLRSRLPPSSEYSQRVPRIDTPASKAQSHY